MVKKIMILILLCVAFSVFADKKGEEIARRTFGLKESSDSYSTTIMVLINKNGEKKITKMESYSKEGKDGRNAFMIFFEPVNVKGTTFLITGHKSEPDEQRLYLPAFGKIRRISPSNKDRKFMGSDLCYYDMEDHEYEDFTYKYLRDDVYDKKPCHLIEMYPTDPYAPYSKQIAWISKNDFFTYKLECFDKKNQDNLIKTIVTLEVKVIDGIIIPIKIAVDNHQENHKTLLQEQDIKINIGLEDTIFSVQNMQH